MSGGCGSQESKMKSKMTRLSRTMMDGMVVGAVRSERKAPCASAWLMSGGAVAIRQGRRWSLKSYGMTGCVDQC